MRLIGLNGRLRSGKDTAFEFIQDQAGASASCVRAGFADKLKLSAALALGFDPESVEEAVEICNKIKESGAIKTSYDTLSETGNLQLAVKRITGREFQQRYGTEAHRDVFGTDFWVDALLPRPVAEGLNQDRWLRDSFPGVDVLVITDVRFENEAQRILDLGGEVWHVEAEQRLGPLPEDAHPSERPLPEHLISRTVRNNYGLKEFKVAVSFAYHA